MTTAKETKRAIAANAGHGSKSFSASTAPIAIST
jgi:hypothetical protein